ncbi:MAG: SpoIIE family protein phosphatase [Limisphaerales bacterium]
MEKRLEMHQVTPVNESSHIGQVRREIQSLAMRIRASEDVCARAALVATELSTNLLKHCSSGGQILYRAIREETGSFHSIEILSLDNGRGIPNISKAFSDGFSTAGSPGNGLGAIQRMSDSMEIFSADQHGTVISTQIRPRLSSKKIPAPRIRSICVPLEGYDVSGDYVVVVTKGSKTHIMVADGLGHGPEAAEASHRAATAFRKNVTCELPDMMMQIHTALNMSRGAAVALANYDSGTRILKYVAVGNIDSRICTATDCRGCGTQNGTAGVRMPALSEFEYAIPPGAVLVMHSDGLSSRWTFNNYPGLSMQTPGVIAGLLFRDFARKRDDATILVLAT